MGVQGSNAHVVMEVCSHDARASVTALPRQMWQRNRYWFSPAAHALLTCCRSTESSQGSIEFVCVITHPALAYLSDNRIRGVPLLPEAMCTEVSHFLSLLHATTRAIPILSCLDCASLTAYCPVHMGT